MMLARLMQTLRCLRSPRACTARLVQRRSASYRYFHVQKKAAQRETRRLRGTGTGNVFRDQFGNGERRP